MKMAREKRYSTILATIIGALLVLPKITTPIDEKFAHSFHKRLTPAGDHLSIVYGHCALQSGIVEKVVAFAPDNTAIAKLARALFFIGDDGKLIVTNNPVSAIPQITPSLWASIASLLTKTEESALKTKEIGALIRNTLKWDEQVANGEKIKKAVIENDPLCKSLNQTIEKIEQELARIDPKKDPVAYENKKQELKIATGALKKAIEILPRSEKRTIQMAAREEKSPEKIARILVDAIHEATSPEKLWPAGFAHVLISAYIVEKFTKKEILDYLEQLPKQYRYTDKKDFRKDTVTKKVLHFFKKAKKTEIIPYVGKVIIDSYNFPDCAENTVLNAINHLAYDSEKNVVSLNKLAQNPLITIHPAVIEYFKQFNTQNLQRDDTAHAEWAKLLSQNKDLEYLQDKRYELSPDIRTILKALGHLIFYNSEYVASDTEVLEKLKKICTVTLEERKGSNNSTLQKLLVDAPAPFIIISKLGLQAHAALFPQKTAANAKIFNTSEIIENNNILLLASVVPLLGQKIVKDLPNPTFDLLLAICQEIPTFSSIAPFWQTISLENAASILWRFAFTNPTIRDPAAFQNNLEEVFTFCQSVRPLALFFENNNKSIALVYTADPRTGFNYKRVVDLLTKAIPSGLAEEPEEAVGLQYVIDFIEKLSSPAQLFTGKQILTIREFIEKSGIPLTSIEKPLFRLASRDLANLSFAKGAKIIELLFSESVSSVINEERIAELIKQETAVSFNLRKEIESVLQSSESVTKKKTELDALIKKAFDLAWPYTNRKAFTASLILAIINTNHSEWLLKLPNGDLLRENLAEKAFKKAASKGKAEKK